VLIVPTYNFDVSLDDAGRSREHVTARVLDALRDRITPPDARTQPHCCFEAQAELGGYERRCPASSRAWQAAQRAIRLSGWSAPPSARGTT